MLTKYILNIDDSYLPSRLWLIGLGNLGQAFSWLLACLPYETQRARQNFPVTFYGFPACGSPCQMGRDMLNKRGIPFIEKSLVMQDDMDAFRKASGDGQMPAITIGKTWLKGFQAEQWNSELDAAGYPQKVLSYRPKAATPPAQAAQ